MSKEKLTGYGVFLIVVALAFGWTAGKSNADEGLEQRISGLEARVSILESEVDSLSSGSVVDETSSVSRTIEILIVARPNTTNGVGVWDDETEICYISDKFHTGAIVGAHDETGKLIGTTELKTPANEIPTQRFPDSCVFEATITVPDFAFITLKFGDMETDPYSVETLETDDWIITLTSRS